MIIAIAVVVTIAVVAISKTLPKTYNASATIVYNPSSTVLQPTDAASIERQLATFQALAQTPAVLSTAAPHLGESASSLKSAIGSSVDPKANIITITATAHNPSLAAARANAVAHAFLSVASGGVKLQVPRNQAGQAHELIAAFRRGELAPKEDS